MRVASEFRPAWWLPGAHAQTLWPYLFHYDAGKLTPERLELPDGDFVDLCLTRGHDAGPADAPVVAVFHGLEGGISSPYAARIMAAVRRRGWRGVFMHFRGCSGVINRKVPSYHSGHTRDIAYLLDTLRKRHPRTPLFAVGYSLGGNALLKYLGERGEDTPVDAAAAVSVPFLLADGAARMSRGFSRIYQHHLIGLMQRKVMHKVEAGMLDYKPEEVRRLKTFYQFDDCVTAPLNGFAGADDYYRQCSSRQYLKEIRVPALIVHARDDPFMTPAAVPTESELSDTVRLELSERGGHVGFIAGGLPWRPEYWLERRMLAYFGAR
ncbi:MAG: hydrolase [Gammaproteobacteria bacterium]|jgi:predicted alpha/beta-fold hydrolase